MELRKLHNSLKSKLSELLDVYAWDTTQFTILPNEPPKGYLQLVQTTIGSVYRTEWMVGIAVAHSDWNALWDDVYTILEKINKYLTKPPPCIDPGGTLSLNGSIDVEVPSSYSNQTGISNTEGWKTAIIFSVVVQGSR